MVEAAGVEPASETTQRQRLRVYPSVNFPGQACGLTRQLGSVAVFVWLFVVPCSHATGELRTSQVVTHSNRRP